MDSASPKNFYREAAERWSPIRKMRMGKMRTLYRGGTDNGYAYNYDVIEKSQEFLRSYFSVALVDTYLQYLQRIQKGESLLDLGSGCGAESLVLQRLNPHLRVVSIDCNDIGVQRGLGRGVRQVQGDVEAIPLAYKKPI